MIKSGFPKDEVERIIKISDPGDFWNNIRIFVYPHKDQIEWYNLIPVTVDLLKEASEKQDE